MLTLKDFIKDTLGQITDAVLEFEDEREGQATARPALKTAGDLGASTASNAGLMYLGKEQGYATVIDFNVAVTEASSEAAKADGGIKVVFANIGGGLAEETSSQTASTIKFSIPLQLSGKGPDSGLA